MTGFNRPNINSRDRVFDDVDDMIIFERWKRGQDTLDIARALQRPESLIHNRLPQILARARQDAEWKGAAA